MKIHCCFLDKECKQMVELLDKAIGSYSEHDHSLWRIYLNGWGHSLSIALSPQAKYGRYNKNREIKLHWILWR